MEPEIVSKLEELANEQAGKAFDLLNTLGVRIQEGCHTVIQAYRNRLTGLLKEASSEQAKIYQNINVEYYWVSLGDCWSKTSDGKEVECRGRLHNVDGLCKEYFHSHSLEERKHLFPYYFEKDGIGGGILILTKDKGRGILKGVTNSCCFYQGRSIDGHFEVCGDYEGLLRAVRTFEEDPTNLRIFLQTVCGWESNTKHPNLCYMMGRLSIYTEEGVKELNFKSFNDLQI